MKDVVAFAVLAIDPPGEVEQQFVEDPFEEGAVSFPGDALLNLIDALGGPGMHGRVHIPKGPLVGRELTIGMHIPLAQEQEELLFGKVRVNQR